MSNKVWAKIIGIFCVVMSVVLFTLIYGACKVTMPKPSKVPAPVSNFEGEVYDWWELSTDDEPVLIIKE